MIAPMSKFSFLVYHQDYAEFLNQVRNIGVVHLIEKKKQVSEEVQERYDQVKEIYNTTRLLEKREPKKARGPLTVDGQAAYQEVRSLLDELDLRQQQLTALRKEMVQVAPWGDFSLKTLEELQQAGLLVKFYTVAARKFDESWLKKYPIEPMGVHAGQQYFVMVHQAGQENFPDAEEMRRPERPISELEFFEKQLQEDIADINKKLDQHAAESLDPIKEHMYSLLESCDYSKALENTVKEADEKVMLLEGWVPDEKKSLLVDYLEKNNFLYVVEKPTEKENIPVMLKNKKFPSRFEMLGELYSMPKYNELDMTPFFAPFYMLFFGFCLGDIGYGMLLGAIALVLKSKVQKELKNVLSLVFYLGISTIVFGIIGGTFFGIPLYETNLPVYRELALRFEAEGTNINQLLFNLALVFGAIQILFGMFLKAINETRQFGVGYAMGTIGWIILLVGMVILGLISQLGNIPFENLRIPMYAIIGVGGVLILFLNNLRRNVLINFGAGLWGTYNMVTGLLGDLLSYIRLFALGISSAIMGFVFNSLAVEMSGNIPVLSIIIMVIILVIGHSINLFMSGLGAFVHPLRLTFVEFYKNAGYTGGGKKYHPFKKIN